MLKRSFGILAYMITDIMSKNKDKIFKIAFSATEADTKKVAIYQRFGKIIAQKFNGVVDIDGKDVNVIFAKNDELQLDNVKSRLKNMHGQLARMYGPTTAAYAHIRNGKAEIHFIFSGNVNMPSTIQNAIKTRVSNIFFNADRGNTIRLFLMSNNTVILSVPGVPFQDTAFSL